MKLKIFLTSLSLGIFFSGFLPLQAIAQEFDPCNATGTTPGGILSTGCGGQNFGFILGQLINFIFVIAVILALGFLIFGGIKWITSGGDKGGVEGARNMIISAIVGLVIIVLAYFILNELVLPFLGLGNGFADLQITPITGGTSDSRPFCAPDVPFSEQSFGNGECQCPDGTSQTASACETN